jgi:hypothetical protein
MKKSERETLRNVVIQCRRLIEESVSQTLQGSYGIHPTGRIEDGAKFNHLQLEETVCRQDLVDHIEHLIALPLRPSDACAQLTREIAFTHLNRLAAYKMMEARGLIRESVSKGLKSQGFLFYLADHEDDEKRANSGQQDVAYRHFLDWLGGTLSEEIGVLFNPHDSANCLYPPQRVLEHVLDLLNDDALADIWTQDETIGWVYQYFTPKELRDKARSESRSPRNSHEMAFRNQFFTPRYVVEFLTDNTLGRIWYEMQKGQTKLKNQCRYMVRRPDEVFLSEMVLDGHENVREVAVAISMQLQTSNDTDFPIFRTKDEDGFDRLTNLALCVNAYETKRDDWNEWYSSVRGKIEASRLVDFSTQDILDFLFVTQRADRHGGDGSVVIEPWFVEAANEVRRRALEGRMQDATPEQLVKAPHFIPHRPKKDPRELKILDPACGSGHFLLYCFDLLSTIYEEAYCDSELGSVLQQDYPTLDAMQRDVPRLILAHNLHGIDIDLRASQIAALALWLRCQRAYQEMGLKKDRPKITRSNFVCAEPMPGEPAMLKEFVGQLEPTLLGQLVEVVFDKMRLAGEAGSLLKIERDIQNAVKEAKRQYDIGGILVQKTLFDKPVVKSEKQYSVESLDNDQFFERAETNVVQALKQYAERTRSENQLQRHLFAEDAVRGFSFVELCHCKFDVILMNPPFGELSKNSKSYIETAYKHSYSDILAAFVERTLELSEKNGLIGAITNRNCFYLTSMTDYRKEVLQRHVGFEAMMDLGEGVLDATVEASIYVLRHLPRPQQVAPFVRLLIDEDKAAKALEEVAAVNAGKLTTKVFYSAPVDFARLESSPFCYWVPAHIIKAISALPPIGGNTAAINVGLQTGYDWRFLRTTWEVVPRLISPSPLPSSKKPKSVRSQCLEELQGKQVWGFFSKTDVASPWYSPITLLVKWEKNGFEIKNFTNDKGKVRSRPQNEAYYFRPGYSYVRRTTRLVPYVVPCGVIPTAGRSQIFPEPDCEIEVLGVCASRLGSAVARFCSEKFGWPMFQASMVQTIPAIRFSDGTKSALQERFNSELAQKRHVLSHFEPWHEFVLPAILDNLQADDAWQLDTFIGTDLEEQIANDAELSKDDLKTLCRDLDDAISLRQKVTSPTEGNEVHTESDEATGENDEEGEDNSISLVDLSPRAQYEGLVSYCIGIVFGRWDMRFALDRDLIPKSQDVLDPLPVVPPGTLISSDGYPATSGAIVSEAWLKARPNAVYLPNIASVASPLIPDDKYPAKVQWDGVLVDSADEHGLPTSPDDIVGRTRAVIEVIFGKQADALEKAACEAIGVRNLREYIRKPGNGGCWLDHVARYSKSRRKAPIYWLLQSTKKNFAIWLYYHRLDKDLLFKALVNHVEPKIRLEVSRLDSLRSQKAAAGDSGKAPKKLEGMIEKQEEFISELQDFEDKLRRAANLHLEPDLNDGVVLNIAPLHELVPWKEARNYWNELIEGKYEWSSIGKQLREKGLVQSD